MCPSQQHDAEHPMQPQAVQRSCLQPTHRKAQAENVGRHAWGAASNHKRTLACGCVCVCRRYRAVAPYMADLAGKGTDVRVFARQFVSAMLVPRPPAFWTGGYLSSVAFFVAFLPTGVRDFLAGLPTGTRSLNLRPSSS